MPEGEGRLQTDGEAMGGFHSQGFAGRAFGHSYILHFTCRTAHCTSVYMYQNTVCAVLCKPPVSHF